MAYEDMTVTLEDRSTFITLFIQGNENKEKP
jgi:hypothetical protein